jgi:hypothetical protein
MSKLGVFVLTAIVTFPIGALAASPLQGGHPNLDAATGALAHAFDKVSAAQKANEWDLGGHAAKAKEAIATAQNELKLSAEVVERKR